MYKIYNNEIKILQFLKGGSAFRSIGTSSSFDLHPIEHRIYFSNTATSNGTTNNDNYGFMLNFDDSNKDIDFNRIRPLFAQEIVFKNFDKKMFIAILLTLSMFAKYIPFLQEDNELGLIFNSTNFGGAANQIPIFGGTPITSLDKAKEIRKKLVKLDLQIIFNFTH